MLLKTGSKDITHVTKKSDKVRDQHENPSSLLDLVVHKDFAILQNKPKTNINIKWFANYLPSSERRYFQPSISVFTLK
jgi:hypothetical protein